MELQNKRDHNINERVDLSILIMSLTPHNRSYRMY